MKKPSDENKPTKEQEKEFLKYLKGKEKIMNKLVKSMKELQEIIQEPIE